MRTRHSRLLIAMYALFGTTRITHIWPYASLAERGERRAASLVSGEWPPATGSWMTADMVSGIYVPAAGSPLR